MKFFLIFLFANISCNWLLAQCNYDDIPDHPACDYTPCLLTNAMTIFDGTIDDFSDRIDSWYIEIPENMEISEVSFLLINPGVSAADGYIQYDDQSKIYVVPPGSNDTEVITPLEKFKRAKIALLSGSESVSYTVTIKLVAATTIGCSSYQCNVTEWIGTSSIWGSDSNWDNGVPTINNLTKVLGAGTTGPIIAVDECFEIGGLDMATGATLAVDGELLIIPN